MGGGGVQGSALAVVIEDSLGGSKPPELQLQQAFGDRTTQCRRRMLGICKIPEAKGVVDHTRFDTVFGAVEKLWHDSVLTGEAVEKAFKAVDDKLDEAEAEIALIIQQAESLKRAKEEFAQKQIALKGRAEVLVAGGFAKATDFKDAIDALQRLHDTEKVTGDEAEAALKTLDDLLKEGEKTAEKARLYAITLKSVDDQLAVLEKNRYVPPDGLDTARAARQEAETLKATDWDAASAKLQVALSEIAKAGKLAAVEQDIDDNRDTYIEMLCEGSLLALKVDEEDLAAGLTPEQFSELVKDEKKSQSLGKLAKGRARDAIRKKYKAFVEQNAPEEEDDDEEEAPIVPVETPQQKQIRIAALKQQSKSINSLITLDAENEIFRTYLVFANKGADFKIGNTGKKGDYVPDWVSGYDVMLKDGPKDQSGTRPRYKKMIVHFHFSDSNYTTIQRAHFKNNHGASDHGHVLIKTANWAAALAICKRHL